MILSFASLFFALSSAAQEPDRAAMAAAMAPLFEAVSKGTPTSTDETLANVEKCEVLTAKEHSQANLDDLGLSLLHKFGPVSIIGTDGRLFMAPKADVPRPMCTVILNTTDHPEQIAQALASERDTQVTVAPNVPDGHGRSKWQITTSEFLYIVSFTKRPPGSTGVAVFRLEGKQ